MKRLMLIDSDEFIKYQNGMSCYVNAVLPTNKKLDYMKLIIKTYCDLLGWSYKIIIEDDEKIPVNFNLAVEWFRDCENYVKKYLIKERLKLQS